ncbi:uncharacterized protein DDB_G0283697-like [Leptopilina heterotoma]|uniref:uncharacterized protein DDB_G0283697-like n=1 Tax=Leptopilina heterotoma TaxID=63436 RepID=UPI001CA7D622|nr:uncharacterized protein DDB_G0283697-like [Leptopilina heterotoma]
MQQGCLHKRSKNKLGLPTDVNVSKEILEVHKRSWEQFFEKYSMETGDVKELNLETLKLIVDENEEICQQRLPMRNPISSVQYWVNTGKPPCLSVVDKNYNSPEETSLSEEEISALHPTAISPLEHNSPHPPQPAIIPSEPTKLCSSIVSSDSVNTRQYILSSNLAKKNMSLTIVENGKLHDLSLNRNNIIDEADVYIDVCGTDEFPKISTEEKEHEKTINSQSTVVYGYNNHILPDSQATTILRMPTGSLKIEDVIPSLRNIRDSPEIYECDTSTSEKSNFKELIVEHKHIVVESIIEKNNRRKLFTNPRSPVEWPQYSSPKRIIARKSSSLSTASTLHPALDFSDTKRNNTWRKRLFYKKKLVTINENNEKPLIPTFEEPIFNGEKLKKCSVVLKPLILGNFEKKRKFDVEKNELESKKIKISPQAKTTETKTNSTTDSFPTNGEISQEKEKFPNEKEQKKNSKSLRVSIRNLRSKTAKLTKKKKGKVAKKKKINIKKLPKRKKVLAKVSKASSKVSEIKTIFSIESDSDDDDDDGEKWTNNENSSKNNRKFDNKRLTNIFTFDSDEEFDMTTIFQTNIESLTKINEGNKTEKIKQSSENNSLFTELSLYTNEEKENQRKSTINNQFPGLNSRRWTKLVILPSSEDEIPREEKILTKERKRKKVQRKKKEQESSKNSKNISEEKKFNLEKNEIKNNSFNQSPKKRKIKKEEKEESSNLDISKNSESTNLNELEKSAQVGENGFEGKNEESEFEDIFEIRPKTKEEERENSKQTKMKENSKRTKKKENSKRTIKMNVKENKKSKLNSNNKKEEEEEVMEKIRLNSKKNMKNQLSTVSSDEEEKEKNSPSRNHRKVKKNIKSDNKNEKTKKINNSNDQFNSSGYETKFDENIPNEIKMKSSIANSSPRITRNSPRNQEKKPEEEIKNQKITKEKNQKSNYFKFSSSDDDEDIFNLVRT